MVTAPFRLVRIERMVGRLPPDALRVRTCTWYSVSGLTSAKVQPGTGVSKPKLQS